MPRATLYTISMKMLLRANLVTVFVSMLQAIVDTILDFMAFVNMLQAIVITMLAFMAFLNMLRAILDALFLFVAFVVVASVVFIPTFMASPVFIVFGGNRDHTRCAVAAWGSPS